MSRSTRSRPPGLPRAARLLGLLLLFPLLSLGRLEGPRQERPSVRGVDEQAEPGASERSDERRRLVERAIAGQGISDPEVLRAMQAVPRHRFLPVNRSAQAYLDIALPIGYGQTISQPYVVAYMTEALHLTPGDRVLEVGTGSGYQAAVLAEIVDRVYSVEIVRELYEEVTARLTRLGYDGIRVRFGDGYFGWAEEAPFDKMIVTAAVDHVPPSLLAQLAPGGRLILPVGPPGGIQTLLLITKGPDGRLSRSALLPVRFVPMTGAARR